MVNPLAQLAILRAQRVHLPARLQPHCIVLHLEKPLGAGQLRGRLREGRGADAGAFDRRVQITEQPVHVFAGQIPRRMRFAEFAVQLGALLFKTPDPRMGIFQRRLQQRLLHHRVRVTTILGSTARIPFPPLVLRGI
jgi:hypothetical protein